MQPGTLARSDTQFISGTASALQARGIKYLFHLFFATAFFQCWQYIVGFAVWATAIVLICKYVRDISVQPTLLTVLGTVLGFIISYRTSSSFERYNEGRHIGVAVGATDDEKRARTLVEKKTILNLIEAFSVAVKHYLRGEEGINYVDLYHLTKYLPAYALPIGMPASPYDLNEQQPGDDSTSTIHDHQGLPPPATNHNRARFHSDRNRARESTLPTGEPTLLPARNPPPFGIFDVFPFTLLVGPLLRRGFNVGGKRAQKLRAKKGGKIERGRGPGEVVLSHNIPLEITLYLSAYIAALQQRKVLDVPTTNLLLASLNAMVDSLSGVERIVTTPIPFSFSVHLWTITLLYCAALPFQLVGSLNWVAIPGTAIAAFIFIGFLVAGEEIENPFGYERNDLNLDYFTQNIIRAELSSITSVPVPDPAEWCFLPTNDSLFSNEGKQQTLAPELWVRRGEKEIRMQLANATGEVSGTGGVILGEPGVARNRDQEKIPGATRP